MPGLLGAQRQPMAVPQQPNALQQFFTPQRTLALQGLGDILRGGTGQQAYQGLQQLRQQQAQQRLQQEGQQLLGGLFGGATPGAALGGMPQGAPTRMAFAQPTTPANIVQTPISDDPIVQGAADAIARTGPAQGNGRADYIRQGLVSRGLTPAAAEGFVMNFRDESRLDPGINEIAPIVPGSRGGFGLAQWTGPRRVALENFAQQTGRPVSDIDTQLDFLVSELQGPESRAARSIAGAQSPQDAAVAIARDFLRPAPEHLERRVAAYQGGAVPQTGTQAQQPQISQQRVAQILAHPAIPATTKEFVLNEYNRQFEQPDLPAAVREYQFAQSQGYQGTFQDYQRGVDEGPQQFQITELADGRKYYVDPTGRIPARPVNPAAQPENIADFETEQKLRKEFGNISTVKDFYAVRDSFNRVQASAEDPSAAGDLALIFNYMKMLDPGSVVRETEFATAQNAAGVPERLRAMFNNIQRGERLTEVQRADFINQAGNVFNAQAGGFNQVVGQYRALAQEYGLDPDRIAQKSEREGKTPEQAALELAQEDANGATAPLIGVGETTVIDGVTIERVN